MTAVTLRFAVLLGLDEADNTKGTLEVYRQHFEKPFLDATTKYYKNESKQFISENSVVDYMKKVSGSLVTPVCYFTRTLTRYSGRGTSRRGEEPCWTLPTPRYHDTFDEGLSRGSHYRALHTSSR